MYYQINESTARTAKHMNSFGEYTEGSATASYRAQVDEAIRIGEEQKAKVDPEYHGKIDYYVDLYARKLAENLNHGYEIETRCPSLLISGGGNFPVAKKVKQNAARDKNMEDYNHVQGILDKIRSIGTGGIRSDDDNAIEKLEKKLAKLQEEQETMKFEINGLWSERTREFSDYDQAFYYAQDEYKRDADNITVCLYELKDCFN